MKHILVCTIFLFFVTSCEKKELPKPKREVKVRTGGVSMPGERIDAQVEMGSDYKNQLWYSLNDAKVIATNLKTDWDLAFECSGDGFHIVLNGSKSMKVYKTVYSELSQVKDTAGIGFYGKADAPSGNKDSTAIGDWINGNKVYVINRGYTETGVQQGYFKLKIESVNAQQFVFNYSSFDGSETRTGIVKKDGDYNFIAYSFTTHKQCENIEPKKKSYDLCFTQYTHWFTDPPQYYLVTGVLINSDKTRIIRILDKNFSDITINDTLNRLFSNQKNAIGYDWKEFDLNTNLYTVNSNMCYIVSDNKGYFYKLHFVGFVNMSGLKGYPSFEFQKL